MNIRIANTEDIAQIQKVRNSVKENMLSDPSLVSNADCEEYINNRGCGWVCEIKNVIVGFAIADLKEHNIWALFIDPHFESMGIGKRLHQIMMDWYFSKTDTTVWLSTSHGTRAEKFYRKAGWKEIGFYHKDEIKFEMTALDWKNKKQL